MAAFHVENERIATFRELLAHHRRRDQRDAFHGRCHVPQRIELLVGWDERRRLADDAGADGTQDSLEFADIKIGAIPRIDSSLSSVPPVWPSPRPDIFGTITPHAAAIGARTIDTGADRRRYFGLPTLIPGMSERSTRSPDWAIASVSQAVSSSDMPRRTIAMRRAADW